MSRRGQRTRLRMAASAPECLFIYAKVMRAERRLAILQEKLNERVELLPTTEMPEYVAGGQKLEAQEEARCAE